MKTFKKILILLVMTLTLWGLLEKSAVDNETIEEAIARLIAVHEADSTAHLGSGESLEAHKNADIIDHPASSVVPDKSSASQPVFSALFGDLNGFTSSGDVTNILGLLTVKVLGNAGADSSIYSEAIYIEQNSSSDIYDGMLQFAFQYTQNYNVATVYVGLGIYDFVPDGSTSQIFLRIANGVLSLGVSNGSTVTYSQISASLPAGRHTFRLVSKNSDDSVDVYFDDVLFSNVALSAFTDHFFADFGVYLTKVGGTTSGQNTRIDIYYVAWANTQISA